MCVSRRRILAGALATNISINYSKQSAAITDDIVKQLRPATDDQPQIPLPMANDPNLRPNLDDLQGEYQMFDNRSRGLCRSTSGEGLIYLKNERNERPIAGSVIMVTVSNKDGQILAGAKLPANRLPIRFRLNERNRLSDSWVEALRSEDLVVTARVCLEVVERVQCETKQQVATGTSKLLRLKQDAGTVMVRPGVSLGLE